MLKGTRHKEKLKQTTSKIAKAKVNFKKLINMLYKELILAKNI
jgi:hypothetical protein